MVATYAFIKRGKHAVALRIVRVLIEDQEDLIHKASGWMLRELGKRAPEVLEEFLDENSRRMPRTMLRYAIEKFPEPKAAALSGTALTRKQQRFLRPFLKTASIGMKP